MEDNTRKRSKKKETRPSIQADYPTQPKREKFVRPTIETKISDEPCPECQKLMMVSMERFGREVGEVRYFCDTCVYEEIDFGESTYYR